jgi:glucosamine-6-phosphate deaminase
MDHSVGLEHSEDRQLAVAPTARLAGEWAAERIGAVLEAAQARGARAVLGCPAGRTPRTSYAAFARLAAARGLDLARLEIVMMDDYVVPAAGGYEPCPTSAPHSCRRFAEQELRAVLNAGMPRERQLPAAQIHFPDARDPGRYEEVIASLGGVDLFLLAAGASDGHVAFNPPGSSLATRTRIVELADSTRRDNLSTFPTLRSLEEVPRYGVTVGLDTLVRYSKAALLLLLGAEKQQALARTLALRSFDPAWPASVIYACANARILADQGAMTGRPSGAASADINEVAIS